MVESLHLECGTIEKQLTGGNSDSQVTRCRSSNRLTDSLIPLTPYHSKNL